MRAAWMNRNGDAWPQGLAKPDAIVSGVDQLAALLTPAAREMRWQ
jgi:hypothetical protein